jgi:hypothetical protein
MVGLFIGPAQHSSRRTRLSIHPNPNINMASIVIIQAVSTLPLREDQPSYQHLMALGPHRVPARRLAYCFPLPPHIFEAAAALPPTSPALSINGPG